MTVLEVKEAVTRLAEIDRTLSFVGKRKEVEAMAKDALAGVDLLNPTEEQFNKIVEAAEAQAEVNKILNSRAISNLQAEKTALELKLVEATVLKVEEPEVEPEIVTDEEEV